MAHIRLVFNKSLIVDEWARRLWVCIFWFFSWEVKELFVERNWPLNSLWMVWLLHMIVLQQFLLILLPAGIFLWVGMCWDWNSGSWSWFWSLIPQRLNSWCISWFMQLNFRRSALAQSQAHWNSWVRRLVFVSIYNTYVLILRLAIQLMKFASPQWCGFRFLEQIRTLDVH